MPRFTGTWTAKVSQQYEIEADSVADLDRKMGDEMNPANVVELTDFDYDIDGEEVPWK